MAGGACDSNSSTATPACPLSDEFIVHTPLQARTQGNTSCSRTGMDDRTLARVLIARMARQDYVGLDTSSIRFNPRLLRIADAASRLIGLGRIVRPLVFRTVFYAGHRAHPFLRPERKRFAKALALTSAALSHLATGAAEDEYAQIMTERARLWSLLDSVRLAGSRVWAHEYPYRLAGTEVTPAVPNLVTTAFVAENYWSWWQTQCCHEARQRFVEVVADAIRVFPYVEHASGICFMYTPVTSLHVHNANLLMAELIAKALSIDAAAADPELVRRAVAYTIEHLRSTGGAPYAGPPTVILRADNYHTGYVLRSLAAVASAMPDLAAELNLQQVIARLLAFYLDQFVDDAVYRDRSRMMETHSTAESILIYKKFASTLSADARERFARAIERTLDLLWNPRGGFFINCIHRLPGGFLLRDRTDLIRWSQAWMAYALAAPCTSATGDWQDAGCRG